MSKPLVKTDVSGQVPQRIAHNLQKYSQSALPLIREVNLPATSSDNKSLITSYKDLDQPARDFALNQKRQLIIGVFTFVILGIGIIMGQKFSGSSKRVVASEGMIKMVPKDAEVQTSEHYQHDKVCYTEKTGEQVCTTRESRNRN